MIIRPVTEDEYDALGELTVQAYAGLPGNVLSDAYFAALRDVAGRVRRAPILVAVEDGHLLGGVTFVPGPGVYDEFTDPDEAGIRMLAVDTAARRRGVGATLVDACLERARAAGRMRLVLFSATWMTAAHELYERLGFRRAPERDWSPTGVFVLRAYIHELTVGP
jgi:ribosomal protein S18 acetylase RimI-like enzyme